MSAEPEIQNAIDEMLVELLRVFDAKVPVRGPFDDVRLKRQVQFGDPATSAPGMLELTIMAMDPGVNAANAALRFLAVRVRKSARGGTVSSTLFHGDNAALQANLEQERREPRLVLATVEELLFGLPEETNPNIWR